MEPGDLIDFETILETPKPDTCPFGGIRVIQPPQDRDEKNVFEMYVQGPVAFPPFPSESKFYHYCHWLKIGKKREVRGTMRSTFLLHPPRIY